MGLRPAIFSEREFTMVAVAVLTKKNRKTASLTDLHHPTRLCYLTKPQIL